MKHARWLLFLILFSGMAVANQITMQCISLGPASQNYWTQMACYSLSGTLTLVPLAVRKDAQPSQGSDLEETTIVDTRTDLAQTVTPAATVAGIEVFLPAPSPDQAKQSQSSGSQNPAARGAGSESSSDGTASNGNDTVASGNSGTTSSGGGSSSVGSSGGAIQPALQQSSMAQLFAPQPTFDGNDPLPTITTAPAAAVAIPEPSPWILLTLGLCTLLYRARRGLAR